MGFDKNKLKKVKEPSTGYHTTVYTYKHLSVVVSMDWMAPGILSRTISIAAHGSEKAVPGEEDTRGILEALGMDLDKPIQQGLGLSIGPCSFGNRYYYTQPLTKRAAV